MMNSYRVAREGAPTALMLAKALSEFAMQDMVTLSGGGTHLHCLYKPL